MEGLEKHIFDLLQRVTALTEQVKTQNTNTSKMMETLEVTIQRIEILEKDNYARKIKTKTYTGLFDFLRTNWLLICGFFAFVGISITSVELALKLPNKEQIYVVKNEKGEI